MGLLSDSEWLLINQLVLKINSIEQDPAFRKRILFDLRVLIPYDLADFYLTYLPKNLNEPHTWESPWESVDPVGVDTPEEALIDYATKHYSQDPLRAKNLPLRSAVYHENEMLSEEDKESDYYHRYYEGFDVLSCLFFHEKHHLGFISLSKRAETGVFTDKEVYILEILEPHLTNRLAKWRVGSEPSSTEELFCHTYHISKRENDVVRCVIAGMSNAEIADELCIGLSTVKKHLENVFKKTAVNNRFGLISLTRDPATHGKTHVVDLRATG